MTGSFMFPKCETFFAVCQKSTAARNLLIRIEAAIDQAR
jgi:hypothetical protein